MLSGFLGALAGLMVGLALHLIPKVDRLAMRWRLVLVGLLVVTGLLVGAISGWLGSPPVSTSPAPRGASPSSSTQVPSPSQPPTVSSSNKDRFSTTFDGGLHQGRLDALRGYPSVVSRISAAMSTHYPDSKTGSCTWHQTGSGTLTRDSATQVVNAGLDSQAELNFIVCDLEPEPDTAVQVFFTGNHATDTWKVFVKIEGPSNVTVRGLRDVLSNVSLWMF